LLLRQTALRLDRLKAFTDGAFAAFVLLLYLYDRKALALGDNVAFADQKRGNSTRPHRLYRRLPAGQPLARLGNPDTASRRRPFG